MHIKRCCTANFNQGWPKLATNTLFTYTAPQPSSSKREQSPTTTTGIAIGVFLPTSATISILLPASFATANDTNGSAPSSSSESEAAAPTTKVKVNVITDYPFGDSVTIKVTVPSTSTAAVPLQVRIPGWATAATLSASSEDDGFSPLQAGLKNGTMASVAGCCKPGATTTVVLALNPAIVVETGWGAALPSKNWPADENHTVSEGYGYFSGAAMNGGDLRHANATFAEATEWCNASPLCVSFTFSNKNVTDKDHKPTTPVDTYFKSMFVTNTDPSWSTWLRIDSPGFGQATNAAAVVRGPLLFARRLDQNVATVRTWPTFNNTDQNVTLDAAKTGAWNHALVLDPKDPAKYMKISTHKSPGSVPFDIQKYPLIIQAKARQVDSWATLGGMAAFAAEPPASPIDCTRAAYGCAKEDVDVELVPYGATNIRLSGLPWVVAAPTAAAADQK